MDRGYVDFRRLYAIHRAGAFFVTRTKINMKYHRVYSHPVPDKTTGVGSDQSIALDGFYSKQDYPQHLRRVSFCDPETGKRLVFLTNNFTLSAEMIAALYKKRWAVELLFKWVKQNLRIKHFYGTSENAVKTQIWIAVRVYVLAAIIKIDLALDGLVAMRDASTLDIDHGALTQQCRSTLFYRFYRFTLLRKSLSHKHFSMVNPLRHSQDLLTK
jgi:IS4 transposase